MAEPVFQYEPRTSESGVDAYVSQRAVVMIIVPMPEIQMAYDHKVFLNPKHNRRADFPEHTVALAQLSSMSSNINSWYEVGFHPLVPVGSIAMNRFQRAEPEDEKEQAVVKTVDICLGWYLSPPTLHVNVVSTRFVQFIPTVNPAAQRVTITQEVADHVFLLMQEIMKGKVWMCCLEFVSIWFS
jgi:hypothetical protein